MGLVSVAHTGWTSWDVPGCGGISGHVRRGTSECGPYWAGTSWDVPGCGGISGHVRRGTSECGPYNRNSKERISKERRSQRWSQA